MLVEFICRKLLSSFRRVRWTTSTVSSAATSNSAPWFTCVALKSKNCHSICASHRGEITPARSPQQPLRYLHADPPFRLMQPPCRHIHLQSQAQLPDSHRRPLTHQSERQTDGRSIRTALCQFLSCNSDLTASDYYICHCSLFC